MREEIYYVAGGDQSLPFYIQTAGISYCDGSYHIRRPNSSVLCMEYILDGCGTIEYDGSAYHPQKDDVYMLPRGKNHNYYSDDTSPWTKIWFNAAGPLTEHLSHAYGLKDTVLFQKTGMGDAFERIVTLCKSGRDTRDINAGCALIYHEIVQRLYNLGKGHGGSASAEAMAIRNYINAHLCENVSAETLAALIFKSRSQTIRLFKKEFGMTPYDYLLNCRLLQAKTLLKNTGLLVKEIADRTGFCDEHYFSDFFKRKCGTSPQQYRKAGGAEAPQE